MADIENGAKAGAAGAAGTLLLGPVAGPIAAGYAADKTLGGSTPYMTAGIAIGAAGLIGQLMGGGGSQSGGVM